MNYMAKEFIKKNLIGELIILAFLVALDLVSKGIMTVADKAEIATIIFKENVLQFTYNVDSGIFGAMPRCNWLFIFIDVMLLISLTLYLILARKGSKFLTYTLAVLIGSVFGFLVDRIFFGGVRSFIDLKFINFPIINYTMITFVIGVILYLVYIIFLRKRKPKIQSIAVRYVQRPEKKVEYGDDEMPTFAGFTIDRSFTHEDNYSNFQFGHYPFSTDDIDDYDE